MKRTLASAAACGLAGSNWAKETTSADQIIDTHVYLGHWPHRRLPGDGPTDLIASLRHNNVSQAWTGSFDGLFHKDIAGVNRRLAETCARFGDGMLIAFGTINPTLPDWEEDIRRCHEVFHMPGIRLHPNYHGYTLDEPRFAKLLDQAAARGLVVQLVAWMEDERHLYLNPHTPRVELKPLAEKVAPVRGLRLVLANGYRAVNDEAIASLLSLKQVYCDIARVESAVELGNLVDKASVGRVVIGSSAPLHGFDVVLSKLEIARLNGDDRRAIGNGNARRVMAMK